MWLGVGTYYRRSAPAVGPDTEARSIMVNGYCYRSMLVTFGSISANKHSEEKHAAY